MQTDLMYDNNFFFFYAVFATVALVVATVSTLAIIAIKSYNDNQCCIRLRKHTGWIPAKYIAYSNGLDSKNLVFIDWSFFGLTYYSYEVHWTARGFNRPG